MEASFVGAVAGLGCPPWWQQLRSPAAKLLEVAGLESADPSEPIASFPATPPILAMHSPRAHITRQGSTLRRTEAILLATSQPQLKAAMIRTATIAVKLERMARARRPFGRRRQASNVAHCWELCTVVALSVGAIGSSPFTCRKTLSASPALAVMHRARHALLRRRGGGLGCWLGFPPVRP